MTRIEKYEAWSAELQPHAARVSFLLHCFLPLFITFDGVMSDSAAGRKVLSFATLLLHHKYTFVTSDILTCFKESTGVTNDISHGSVPFKSVCLYNTKAQICLRGIT